MTTTVNKFYLKLYKVYNNTLKMLIERGYEESVNKYYLGNTFAEFKQKYIDDDLTLHCYKTIENYNKSIKKDKLKVHCITYFVKPDSRVGKTKQQFYKLMNEIKQTFDKNADLINLIFIADDKETNSNMSSINKYVVVYQKEELINTETQSYKLELFTFSEKSFNLPEHILVPKHELIRNPNKIKEIIKIYKCNRDNLPKIFINDPVSRYYNAERGQLFKIYRTCPTSGIEIYYRIVV